ncbi:MAG: FtsX-like permease family protein [Clostridium sp.]
MYNAFKSLIKSKKLFIIAVLQLSFGLCLLNYTGAIIDTSRNKVERFTSLFDFDRTYLSRSSIKFSSIENSTVKYDYLPNIIEKLEEMKKDNLLSSYFTYFSIPNPIPSLVEKISDKPYMEIVGDETFKYAAILLNEEVLNKNKLNVIEGRSLTFDDFNKDYTKNNIPILLGKDYSGIVNIGDTFTVNALDITNTKQDHVNFEVVGILDTNQLPTVFSKNNLISGVSFIDSIAIIPTVKNAFSFSSEVALSDFGIYATLSDNAYLPKFTEEFETICEKYNYDSSILSLNEDLENTLGNLNRELYQSLIIGIVLTFLSIVGISSVMLGNLSRRYNEFGIKLSQGASIKVIIKELLFEVLITVSSAILISILLLNFRKFSVDYSLEFFIRNIIFCLSITVIICIPIINKIRKLNIIDLVRGK